MALTHDGSESFVHYDVDGDGFLSGAELQAMLAEHEPVLPSDSIFIEAILDAFAADGSDGLDERGFQNFWAHVIGSPYSVNRKDRSSAGYGYADDGAAPSSGRSQQYQPLLSDTPPMIQEYLAWPFLTT